MVLFLTLLLVVTGIVAWISLPIDAFPDVTNIQVMVLTEAPGLSAVDVEQQISYPIELQMGGIPRVLQVRSLSKGQGGHLLRPAAGLRENTNGTRSLTAFCRPGTGSHQYGTG